MSKKKSTTDNTDGTDKEGPRSPSVSSVLSVVKSRRVFDPGSILLPYQRAWADDGARWKFGLMSRQVGKDFSSGYEGIRDIYRAEAKKEKRDWLIAAPSERQSLESLNKWKDWAAALQVALADYSEDRDGGSQALLKAATITFPGGSRVMAVPGKPDTVRGYSANVLMTEFAFFEDPDATWRAILPSISNSLRGGVKKVRLITTPNGIGNKAHDMWQSNYDVPDAKWSCHFVPIARAVADGLPFNIEEMREAYADPEGWSQEYDCEFIDVQSTLLPYELIATCESADATESMPSDYWITRAPDARFMGLDFGRSRDLTCGWTVERLGDVAHTREVLCLAKMSTPQQVELLRPRIRQCSRVCLDYTGPGVGLGDYLVKEFSEYNPDKHQFGKIELCNFSNTLKVDIFSKLRMAFEKMKIRIPISRIIREDLHSVNRVTTPSGMITYKAPHTADGHADRATGLALAIRAAGDGANTFAFQRVRASRRLGLRGEGVLA